MARIKSTENEAKKIKKNKFEVKLRQSGVSKKGGIPLIVNGIGVIRYML